MISLGIFEGKCNVSLWGHPLAPPCTTIGVLPFATFPKSSAIRQIGIETQSGQRYLSIPVSNSKADYEEYYRITPEMFDAFSADPKAAWTFVEQCRRRERDELLLIKPRSERGVAI